MLIKSDVDFAQNGGNLELFYERFLREKFENLENNGKLFLGVYSNKNQGAVWRTDIDESRYPSQPLNKRGESLLMRLSRWMFLSGCSEIKMKVDLFIDDLRKIVVLGNGQGSTHSNMSPGLHSASSNLQFENLLSNGVIIYNLCFWFFCYMN
jgi:hypothetical protein